METEFISAHAGITYKIPCQTESGGKFARFVNGRLIVKDEEVISYLRGHPDYGITLTEVEFPLQAVVVDVATCQQCGQVFRSKQALSAHMQRHKYRKSTKNTRLSVSEGSLSNQESALQPDGQVAGKRIPEKAVNVEIKEEKRQDAQEAI